MIARSQLSLDLHWVNDCTITWRAPRSMWKAMYWMAHRPSRVVHGFAWYDILTRALVAFSDRSRPGFGLLQGRLPRASEERLQRRFTECTSGGMFPPFVEECAHNCWNRPQENYRPWSLRERAPPAASRQSLVNTPRSIFKRRFSSMSILLACSF